MFIRLQNCKMACFKNRLPSLTLLVSSGKSEAKFISLLTRHRQGATMYIDDKSWLLNKSVTLSDHHDAVQMWRYQTGVISGYSWGDSFLFFNSRLVSLVTNKQSLCCFYGTLLLHYTRWVTNSQDIALTWYLIFFGTFSFLFQKLEFPFHLGKGVTHGIVKWLTAVKTRETTVTVQSHLLHITGHETPCL